MNTNGTIADLPTIPQNKRPQRQRAKRVQRLRQKEARRHREKRHGYQDEVEPKRLAWPINEGARRAGVSRTTIYKLAAQKKIRLIKILGRTLLPDSEIVRIVEGD
jgi:excisionase family DNA binding protein